MQNYKTILLALTILATTFNACKKDDDTNLPYQAKGSYGNANVSAKTFTVSWTINPPTYYVDIYDGDITSTVINSGSVDVYGRNGSGGWIALPYTIPMTSTYASTFTVVSNVGVVRITKTDTDMTQATDPGATTFKIVCISPAARMANPNVNYKNYEEVKKTFNLKD